MSKLIKKLTKAIATAGLASAMVVAPLTACNNTSEKPVEPGAKYSQLLNDVLESEYYTDLIKNNAGEFGGMPNSHEFDPHPYGFLKKQGHDVEAIKKGNLECETICYTKETDKNNYFVNTRVETVDNFGDYYTCYTLKYSITNKEYEDLYDMHDSHAVQAAFMVQELSNQKTPKIEHKSQILKTTYNSLIDSFNKKSDFYCQPFNTDKVFFQITDYSTTNNTLKLEFMPNILNTNTTITISSIRVANLIPSYYAKIELVENTQIIQKPEIAGFKTEQDWENYKNSAVSVTYFESQHINLFNADKLYDEVELNK